MKHYSGDLICASLFTGVYDVNRNELLASDDYGVIEKWCKSIENLGMQGVVFHNNFSESTISEANLTNITFIRVDFNTKMSANVFRYNIYLDFLEKQGQLVENLFVTDIADVEVVLNPFETNLFKQNEDCLFCGDEAAILENEWMFNHCTHLRNSIPDFKNFEHKNNQEVLLNCGIIGGKREIMLHLLKALTEIHNTVTISNKTPYTLDMGAFNYVARTQFEKKIRHGYPINTRFKGYESERTDCWFRHK